MTDQITAHQHQAIRAGLLVDAATRTRSPVERHARHSDALVLRLLAISTKSLRYWSTGFDEDDEVANTWREFHGKEVDDLLTVAEHRKLI